MLERRAEHQVSHGLEVRLIPSSHHPRKEEEEDPFRDSLHSLCLLLDALTNQPLKILPGFIYC